jgi:hypothetical protein
MVFKIRLKSLQNRRVLRSPTLVLYAHLGWVSFHSRTSSLPSGILTCPGALDAIASAAGSDNDWILSITKRNNRRFLKLGGLPPLLPKSLTCAHPQERVSKGHRTCLRSLRWSL